MDHKYISVRYYIMCFPVFPSTPKAADKGAASNAHVTQCSERPKSRERIARGVCWKMRARRASCILSRKHTQRGLSKGGGGVLWSPWRSSNDTKPIYIYYYGEQCAVWLSDLAARAPHPHSVTRINDVLIMALFIFFLLCATRALFGAACTITKIALWRFERPRVERCR